MNILALWPNADSEVRTPRVLRLSVYYLPSIGDVPQISFQGSLPSFIRSQPPFFAAQTMRRPSINVIGVNLSYRLRYCPSDMVEVMTGQSFLLALKAGRQPVGREISDGGRRTGKCEGGALENEDIVPPLSLRTITLSHCCIHGGATSLP